METLKQIFYLNNEGVALLRCCKPKQAILRFNKALTIAASSARSGVGGTSYGLGPAGGIMDLCHLNPVHLACREEDSFYFFNEAMYLTSETFQRLGYHIERTLEFFATILLMNTALGHFQLAYASLEQQHHATAQQLFEKALKLYGSVANLFSAKRYPAYQRSKTGIFLSLAARNNYIHLCLKLGLKAQAKRALTSIKPFVENGDRFLPSDSMPFVEEMNLNTAVLCMTGVFSHLPAAAA